MKPKAQQLGILPDLDGDSPANYAGTDQHPLNRQVWLAIHDRGSQGATIQEVSIQLSKSHASITTRFNELRSLGYLRLMEAERDGRVYCVTEKILR